MCIRDRLYTDCGMFTCNPLYGEDATAVFNMLSGYSEPLSWNRLAVAPLWLRDTMLRRIRREKENAENGKMCIRDRDGDAIKSDGQSGPSWDAVHGFDFSCRIFVRNVFKR